MDVNSTGWRLFNTFFSCRAKQKHLTPESVIKEWGVVTTTIPEYDAGLAESLTDFRANAPRMAEMISQGMGVYLKFPNQDAEKIYQLIQAHFQWYGRKIRSAILFDNEKLLRVQEDLKALDLLNHSCWRMIRNKVMSKDNPTSRPALRGRYSLDSLLANQLFSPTQNREEFDAGFRPLDHYVKDDDFYRLFR